MPDAILPWVLAGLAFVLVRMARDLPRAWRTARQEGRGRGELLAEGTRGAGGVLAFVTIVAAVVAMAGALVVGAGWLLDRASRAAHALSLKDIPLVGVVLLAVIAWQLARRA